MIYYDIVRIRVLVPEKRFSLVPNKWNVYSKKYGYSRRSL